MSEQGAAGSSGGKPADDASGSSIPPWALPVAALLVGALLGGGAVALLSGSEDREPPRALPSPSPTDTASPDPVPTEADVLIRVPAPCVEVAGDAEAVVGDLDQLAAAARDFDARRLQEILDRLQKLRPQVEALADQCRDAASQGIADGQLISPAPLPTPS